jgi:NAD(P)-dependent dehydrogenase (short-subunit alcohol dehydrogenase family)
MCVDTVMCTSCSISSIRRSAPCWLQRSLRGSIVNVASEAALCGSAAGAAYTASKQALVGLTRSCTYMYGPLGIRPQA